MHTESRPAMVDEAHGGVSRRRLNAAALGLALAYLAAGLWLLPDYGPTWDCARGEYPWGEKMLDYFASGEGDLVNLAHRGALLEHRQPHLDYSTGMFPWFMAWPVTALLSALSCRLFWTGLGWMPALQAHNLAVVLWVALLAGAVVRFAGRRLGLAAGLGAALFLLLSPRFFAHGFNNLRDMPEACLYGFSLMAAYLALTTGRLRWWAAAGALTGLALAQKPNALFIPVHLLLFLLTAAAVQRLRKEEAPRGLRGSWRGLLLAALAFAVIHLAVSPALWHDTFNRIESQYAFMLKRGNPLLGSTTGGTAAYEADRGISLEGPLYLLWTTPPPILLLALVGLFAGRCGAVLRCFLAFWALFPPGRTCLPGMQNFDGIRHFMECYPGICVLAGLGLRTAFELAERGAARIGKVGTVPARALIWCAAVAPCAAATAATHPNGICYFNFLIGGLKGAQDRGLADATDYWGNAYWQGMDWLNRHGAEGASLFVPLAGHVAACAAPVKLRGDLRLQEPGQASSGSPLYVMYITRRGWYGSLIRELERSSRRPVHEITVQGGVVLRIFSIDRPEEAEAFLALGRDDLARAAFLRVKFFLRSNPERAALFEAVMKAAETGDGAEIEGRLRAALPQELEYLAPDLMWYFEKE